jgi:hypothetical protein
MISQRYTELITEYRSVEMGDAIFSIFDFFVNDCDKNEKIIETKYLERYKREIKRPPRRYKRNKYRNDCYDPHKTLHFKRRLVDYYFWLLADLRFNPDYRIKLPKKQLRKDFGENERFLLNIVQRMNIAAKSDEIWLDASSIDKTDPDFPRDDKSPMARYRKKLYKEAKQWE